MLASGSSRLFRGALAACTNSISRGVSQCSGRSIARSRTCIINNVDVNNSYSYRSYCSGTSCKMNSASAAATEEAKAAPNSEQLEEEYKKEIGEIQEEYKDRARRRNSILGVVVSTMCQKSISVQYYHNRFYPKYHCTLPVRRKIMAHDAEEKCNVGDLVRVTPGRPMSKMKRHHLLEIVKKGNRIADAKTGRREKIHRIFPK
jgi:small subunit ribosomal protein S17